MSRRTFARAVRRWALAALASGLCGCAWIATRPGLIRYRDPAAGATFVAVAHPLIFFHDRPQLAARTRDYATVAAACVTRDMRTQYVLLVYFWSTIDPRIEQGPVEPTTGLLLTTRERRIALAPMAMAVPPLDRPPVAPLAAAMYRTDLATLRDLSTDRHLSLRRLEAHGSVRYRLWNNERAAIADLIRSTSRRLP